MCIGEKRTLTIAPSYGYGDRNVGPIPAGSTLGEAPRRHLYLDLKPYVANLSRGPVFETELMGIEGVPKPESIVTKSATETPAAAASQEAEKVATEAEEADADASEERSEL